MGVWSVCTKVGGVVESFGSYAEFVNLLQPSPIWSFSYALGLPGDSFPSFCGQEFRFFLRFHPWPHQPVTGVSVCQQGNVEWAKSLSLHRCWGGKSLRWRLAWGRAWKGEKAKETSFCHLKLACWCRGAKKVFSQRILESEYKGFLSRATGF